MVVNARKEADLINPATNTPLELDLFLPSLHLAFEHQVFIPLSSLKSKYWTESMTNNRINPIMLMSIHTTDPFMKSNHWIN